MQVAFYLAGEITQVLDAIPWVCCASGNVYNLFVFLMCFLCWEWYCVLDCKIGWYLFGSFYKKSFICWYLYGSLYLKPFFVGIVFVWKLVDMQILWFLFFRSAQFVSAASVMDHCGETTWKPAPNNFLTRITCIFLTDVATTGKPALNNFLNTISVFLTKRNHLETSSKQLFSHA